MGCSQSKPNAANSPSEVRSVPPSPAPAVKPTEQPTPVKPLANSIQSPVPSKPTQPVAAPQNVPEPVVPPAPVVEEPKHAPKEEHVAAPEPVAVPAVQPAAPVHREPTPEPPPPVRTNKPAPPAEEERVPAPVPQVEPVKPVQHQESPVVAPAAPAAPAPKPEPEPVVHSAPAVTHAPVAAVAPAPAAASHGVTMITPNVGFVIKTKDLNTHEKIFINILYHEKVTEMIPVPAKESTDKKGERCLAYSVVLASSLFQLSHKYDSPEINQVSLSSIDLINRTYNINLDSDYKIPRMKRGFVGDDVDDVALPNTSSTAAAVATATAAAAHVPAAAPAHTPAVAHKEEVVVAAEPTATDAETHVHVPAAATTAAAPAAAAVPEPVKESEPEAAIPSETTPAVAPTESHHHHVEQHAEPAPVVHHAPEPAAAPVVTEPEPVAAAAAPSADATPTATDVTTDIVLPAAKPVPPKMHGWLKKRGHVVLNWKSRYFVLDNGYLTYFVDKLDHPPYGKDMKGQLCLAGYREVPITEETAGSSAAKRNTSAAEEALWTNRLHLVYDPALFDSEASNTKGSSNSEDDYQDLLLEAASPEEKAAWLSAINAHTEYFESTLTLGANLLAGNGSASTAAAGAGASSGSHSPTAGGRSSTMSVAGAPRLQSVAGRNSTSSYSVVDDNKRWMIFLHSGEEIVLTGLTAKPNPMGIHLMRQLILTSHKRLLYIDGKTMEQKGEIEWSKDASAAYPQIKLIDDSTFEIAESAKKTYKFITKDMLNAKDWVHAVETTVKK